MSPVPVPTSSPAALSNPGFPAVIPPHWNNPVPDIFRQLDNRTVYLVTEKNSILEMHPNGPRGIQNYTEYCMLTIFIVNISFSTVKPWEPKGNQRWAATDGRGTSKDTLRVIQGKTTGKYLCMNDDSVPYSKNFTNDSTFSRHCFFYHSLDRHHRESYYREINGTKWYLGINKNGQMRCGNVTTKPRRESRFHRQEEIGSHSESPTFVRLKKPCCPKDKCEGRKSRDKCKCAKNKNWCKKKRRQFFKLSLKELKRYFKRCIEDRKVRKCKCPKKKKSGKDR